MNNLRRIDVLLNEKTGERFNRDDIVQIKTYGTFSREIIGRIDWIDTLELMIDMSDKFNNKSSRLKFEEVGSIEKYNDNKESNNGEM